MKSSFTSATCPECQTHYAHVPVAGDGIDLYAALEVALCQTCGSLLCRNCPQFACDGCGQPHCIEHQVVVPDGTEQPLKLCAACALEGEAAELPAGIPAKIEPQSAPVLVPAIVIELSIAACPECLSAQIVCEPYDFGREQGTGYHDAGERFRCLACGAVGDADEVTMLEALPARRPLVAEVAAHAGEVKRAS